MNRRDALENAAALFVLALSARAETADALAPERFTVESDGHPLAVWARIPPVPRASAVLLHGRTWSSRPAFDLQVPGLQRSVLISLAAQGVATYALDARGYGATPRDATGWLTPSRAAADVATVLKWVAARHQTLVRPALLGWSLGGAIAHLAAATAPALLSSLVLYGYAPDPATVVEAIDQPPRPLLQRTTRQLAAADFVTPKVTPRAVIRAFVETAIKTDPIAVDWNNLEEFTYDSSLLSMPTLLLYGDHDPSIDPLLAKYFFQGVDTANKQLVVLPGGDHCAHLESTHPLWVTAVTTFLNNRALAAHP